MKPMHELILDRTASRRVYSYNVRTSAEMNKQDVIVLEGWHTGAVAKEYAIAYFKSRGYNQEASVEFLEQYVKEQADYTRAR